MAKEIDKSSALTRGIALIRHDLREVFKPLPFDLTLENAQTIKISQPADPLPNLHPHPNFTREAIKDKFFPDWDSVSLPHRNPKITIFRDYGFNIDSKSTLNNPSLRATGEQNIEVTRKKFERGHEKSGVGIADCLWIDTTPFSNEILIEVGFEEDGFFKPVMPQFSFEIAWKKSGKPARALLIGLFPEKGAALSEFDRLLRIVIIDKQSRKLIIQNIRLDSPKES